ncbi:MAG: MYXO-CTERM sorting domain-containing protein [Verrucomicrobiales bacterium]
MHDTRNTILLTALAAGVLSLTNGYGALTQGLAYSAYNITGATDPTKFTTVPAGPVPFVSTAWTNVSSVNGAYISDGGGDGIQVGAAAVWNRVGATAEQTDPATTVYLLYRGFFYDSDGLFAFAENIDDDVQVSVDGTIVLLNDQGTQNGAWQTPTSSLSNLDANGSAFLGNTAWTALTPAQQGGDFGVGWHMIEIRLGEHFGTGGPHNNANSGVNWNDTFGFGIAGLGDTPLPDGAAQYDALSYSAFDVAAFDVLATPDGGPALRYDDIDETGGTNIIIPEPAGFALLLGGLGLGAVRRRRRA